MLNLMRADIYRLAHGKVLWVSSGVMAFFFVLTGSGLFSPTFRMTVDRNQVVQAGRILSGAQAPYALMASPEFLVLLFLPVLIAIAATDFSVHTLQNSLAKGRSRLQLYLSRLLLACAAAVLFDLLGIGLALLAGTAVLGFGRAFTGDYLAKLAEACALQLPSLLGVVSIGVFLIFLTRRTAVVVGLYLVLFGGSQVAAAFLTAFSSQWTNLFHYDLMENLKQAASAQSLAGPDVLRIVLVGAGFILVPTLLGMWVFERSDISS